MHVKDSVSQFVRDALLADRSRDDIRKALKGAGWSGPDINEALAQYAEVDFNPPVPVPRPQWTARDLFIYAVLFTALTFTAIRFVYLVHAILDLWLPDPTDYPFAERSAMSRMRWSVATLIISAPVFLWMSHYTRKRIERSASHSRSPVRRSLTYLALFVSAMTFFGNATFLIYMFLEGGATLRLVLKAATVAGVTLAIFVFYLRDVEYFRDER